MTVAGGLTLGIPAAAAAGTVMSPVAPAGDGAALSPEPVTAENAEEPGENVDASPVVQENGPGTAAQQPVHTTTNNNGGVWNRNAGGWSYPLAYTYSDTKTINAQPIAAPAGAGTGRGAGPSVTGVGPAIGPGTGAGAGGAEMAPLQNATQSAEQWPGKGPVGAGKASAVEGEPEELPGETTDEEGLPGEETDEEESPEKDTTDEAETGEADEADEADEDEADEADEAPAGMAPEEMAGPAPVAAAGPAAGPVGGARLPFTGAPVSVAVAGAGLLAVALGCTLATARRRRSTDAG
ncbi:hypothetical protein [Microbispora sp. H10670]|uniref:hypothetical protein n=1 Tax=Microbispora sp. H10670 TaxID=2729108 RepID=UPI0015FFA7ED|nr:hypothetical protein [Microbispora sp. H10670]